jgi:hypothetical protein
MGFSGRESGMATCDKCGKDVPLSNDAVALQSLIEYGTLPDGFMILNYGSRHLLPVEGCEGSPSRAQFLEGQPRDERIDIYTSTLEAVTRAAYQKLLELANKPKMGFSAGRS